jgi:hypothetical protein
MSYLPVIVYQPVRSGSYMIHFIVAIQQAIQTQKKLHQQSADQQKDPAQQSGKPAPSTSKNTRPARRRKPFWKRWFTSGK